MTMMKKTLRVVNKRAAGDNMGTVSSRVVCPLELEMTFGLLYQHFNRLLTNPSTEKWSQKYSKSGRRPIQIR